MQIEVVNSQPMSLEDAVFSRDYNAALVHQLVVAYMAGARQGSHKQKNRSEVRGGGKKPWRQKGTGRARAGTSRGPIWRGGGVTFAKTTRDYSVKFNRKMRVAAMQVIVSQLLRENRLQVVDDQTLLLPEPRVKAFQSAFGALLGDKLTLIVTDAFNTNLLLGSRNLPGVRVEEISALSPVSLVRAQKVLFCKSAIEHLTQQLSPVSSTGSSSKTEETDVTKEQKPTSVKKASKKKSIDAGDKKKEVVTND